MTKRFARVTFTKVGFRMVLKSYKQFKTVSFRLGKKPLESGSKFIKTKNRIKKSVKDYVACELR